MNQNFKKYYYSCIDDAPASYWQEVAERIYGMYERMYKDYKEQKRKCEALNEEVHILREKIARLDTILSL